MHASVIIRSRDEAPRLRLGLVALAKQSVPAEIIVVNDGSTDSTDAVLRQAARETEMVRLNHAVPRGRSAAANAGAAVASGDILIFLDGDFLAAPDLVGRHLERHRTRPGIVARGETYHLRGTRFFSDPESGMPQPGEAARVARMSGAERAGHLVTREDVVGRFDAIAARAQPAIYPGAGPRRLFQLEMEALSDHPDCPVLWAAASGSNQSVARSAFLQAGGFDEELTINEHRELALRLVQAGLAMVPVGARSYHLTHRSGWRDPLVDTAWERVFYRRHPSAAVALLAVFWASLGDQVPFPQNARIASLPALAAAAARCGDVRGIDAVREAHYRNSAARPPSSVTVRASTPYASHAGP